MATSKRLGVVCCHRVFRQHPPLPQSSKAQVVFRLLSMLDDILICTPGRGRREILLPIKRNVDFIRTRFVSWLRRGHLTESAWKMRALRSSRIDLRPKSVRDMQILIGFGNLYRRFMQGFSRIAAHLPQCSLAHQVELGLIIFREARARKSNFEQNTEKQFRRPTLQFEMLRLLQRSNAFNCIIHSASSYPSGRL